jgi:hypothetical protein
MGISVGAVKARVFHGRKKLREKLKHYVGASLGVDGDPSRRSITGGVSQDQISAAL